MLNPNQIRHRLVNINPLMRPTDSVTVLKDAVAFVARQIRENNGTISAATSTAIEATAAITINNIIESPTRTLTIIRDTLKSIREDLPQGESYTDIRIPEDVDSMRYVTSVESLANALLSIIRCLHLLAGGE